MAGSPPTSPRGSTPAQPADPATAPKAKAAAPAKAKADALTLTLAEAAEAEALLATAECHAAAMRIQVALDRDAAKRATVGTPPPLSDPSGTDDGDPKVEDGPLNHDLHHAMLLHEAAAILNLRAQAVSIKNIR